MAKLKILLVDDERDILDLLEYNLEKEGFEVFRAQDGRRALEMLDKVQPDMVLLDVMMPGMDGIETCRRMREMPQGRTPYIVFLTARSEEYSEIAGLEAGGDDYIVKPIKPRLLMSRIKAIFRRDSEGTEEAAPAADVLRINDLEIHKDAYTVMKKGKSINLPKKEFELLYFLASRPGKVFSREVLLEMVWGTDVHVVDRTIDVHVRKLREKIGKKSIQTVKGVGYKFIEKK